MTGPKGALKIEPIIRAVTKISNCGVNTNSGMGTKNQTVGDFFWFSFSKSLPFSMKVARDDGHSSRQKSLSPSLNDNPDNTNAVQDVIGSECLGLLSLKKVTFK